MTSPVDLFIDDLLARRIVKSDGRVTNITIPGFADLNESQQAQIIARLQQEEREGLLKPGFDPRALEDALSRITPPGPTKEEMLIEDRGYEIRARQDLEADGCPPCYPPDLQIPLQNVPEDYKTIVSYWQFFGNGNNTELLAQFRDWERFREYQKRVRTTYVRTKTPFSEYLDRVRQRRQKNGLGGEVYLRFSLEERDRKLENWIEFQAYHIHACIEKFEDDIAASRKKRDKLQKDVDIGDAAVSKHAAEILMCNQQHWKYQERKLEMEKLFLQWTEQQRIAMDPGYPTPVEEDRGNGLSLSGAVRKAANSEGRRMRSKARAVLGKAGIGKRTPSQRASKAKQIENLHTKLAASSQRRAARQKRSSDAQPIRQSQSALVEVTTRSGRVSRPPVMWVPV